MDETTIVLPSSRAIRHAQLEIGENSLFLPNFITMSEFISKLCRVKEYKFIDEDSRVLLLLEASNFQEFESLQIERNFFTFTKNSSYIFKFFEEISAELYDIKKLKNADVYAEYEEHIIILIELYKRYENLCRERKFLDKIFLPKLYVFNEEYAQSHKGIRLNLYGHLTNFEFELLNKCAAFTKIEILFSTSRFNIKMQQKFADFNIVLNEGYEYLISFNDKTILSKIKIQNNQKIQCESFSETLLQVAFVKKKIYDFVKEGYKPERIAVILPNESMAMSLKSFDEKSNFNFAMGIPFKESKIYEKLSASLQAIEQDSKENEARVKRVGEELYTKLHTTYYKTAQEVDFMALLELMQESIGEQQEQKIFKEEVYNFQKILPFMYEMSLKSLWKLFLQRLSKRSMDDVRGGKITVMGLLETRAVCFDAIVIVDFDEKNVPKRSDKDMFLNTLIRQKANLPTMSDRENLQKHYYESLIHAAQEVAISYVSSQESKPSRFLKQLRIAESIKHEELEYANILFHRERIKSYIFEDKTIEYSFKEIKLSATRLKTFLTCKRKYYYKYIQKLKNHIIESDMPEEYEIGNSVHLALKELYTKQNFYENGVLLKKDLERELDGVCGKSELDKYLIAMQKKRLQTFADVEIKRFKEGWRVAHVEEYFETSFCGLQLEGRIDRIDKRLDEIEVLDYKTGSYALYNKNNFTEAVDFQLEFYYLLALGEGSSVECGFYDLKESKIISEVFLHEKLEILKSHIKDLLLVESLDTKRCEDERNCLYCEYRVMCLRG